MRIPRLHVPRRLAQGETLLLDGQPAHHVTRVLRLRPGACLRVFDGKGCEHEAVLVSVTGPGPAVEIGAGVPVLTESPLSVTLVQGIPRSSRMDLILQKSVELGVSRIQPLWTKRSLTNLNGARLEKRLRHWEGIIGSACEQCGRATLPALEAPLDFAAWVRAAPAGGLRILLHPEGGCALRDLGPPREGVLLLAGPEGGLSPEERQLALQAGMTGVRLGPRILRTETAALAALAGMQALWGDFQ